MSKVLPEVTKGVITVLKDGSYTPEEFKFLYEVTIQKSYWTSSDRISAYITDQIEKHVVKAVVDTFTEKELAHMKNSVDRSRVEQEIIKRIASRAMGGYE